MCAINKPIIKNENEDGGSILIGNIDYIVLLIIPHGYYTTLIDTLKL